MATDAVEQADRAPESNVVAEDIAPHELVIDNVGTGLELVDGDESDWDGIAMQPKSGEWIHEHDEDTSALEYDASDNDRASYGGREDGAIIRPLTILDSTNGESAPSISEGDVVGVPDSTVGDGETEWAGRIVQEGYSNGTTTFNRTNTNFVPIGKAMAQGPLDGTIDSFDDEVRVQVRVDL